jgi:hypothetical protein
VDSVLRSYAGTAEQNAILWRNLEALRGRSNVPPNVVQGLNEYRVATVRAAREQVVRDMLSSGQYKAKDLAGFVNTGTWNDARKFALKSDIDFTAVGRDPKAVAEFQKRFYEQVGQNVGVKPGQVIKTLDVNCYSMGGMEPGAYRTPGGRRFFEVYSAKTGGYEAITGSGKAATVTRSHIDNAFYDLGRSVPKFTPADAAGFAGELRSQMQKNAAGMRGMATAEAKANAKLVERAAYASAVGEGKVLGQGAAQVVREAQALRAGKSMEEALAGRVQQMMAKGMGRQEALQAATRGFVNDTRGYINNTASNLANKALQSDSAAVARTEGMLAKLSGGKLAVGALRGAMGAASLYFIHDAYQREGKAGMAKEIIKQGLYHYYPPAILAELAGMGVKAGTQAVLDYANQCKSDAVLRTMFGDSPERMMDFYNKYHDPVKFRAYVEREWKEQDQFGGAYYGKGLSSAEMKELIFDQGRAMMLNITTAVRDQHNAEQRAMQALLNQVRAEQAEQGALNEDRELTADLRDQQRRERDEFRRKEDLEISKGGDTAASGGDEVPWWAKAGGARSRGKRATEGGAENRKGDQPEEPETQAGVAPNLVRTNWRGQIALQTVGEQGLEGKVVFPIQFSIDNFNRLSGSCQLLAFVGQSSGDGVKTFTIDGRYDSRNGRVEIPLESKIAGSKKIASIAGIAVVESNHLVGRLTGTADSDSLITGDFRGTVTVATMAGHPYNDAALVADANKLFPVMLDAKTKEDMNAKPRHETLEDYRKMLSGSDGKPFPVEATWRVDRVK